MTLKQHDRPASDRLSRQEKTAAIRSCSAPAGDSWRSAGQTITFSWSDSSTHPAAGAPDGVADLDEQAESLTVHKLLSFE